MPTPKPGPVPPNASTDTLFRLQQEADLNLTHQRLNREQAAAALLNALTLVTVTGWLGGIIALIVAAVR